MPRISPRRLSCGQCGLPDRYDASRAGVQTWLLAIARNVLIDERRSARFRRQVGIDELRDLAMDEPSPEERMLRREEVGAP
jgi:DNA-directed RNA polymerase specialized sigma24 family protein